MGNFSSLRFAHDVTTPTHTPLPLSLSTFHASGCVQMCICTKEKLKIKGIHQVF